MRVIRKFFCQFDMFQASASFRIKEQPEMKTFTIGFLSFILACFFFYVFIDGAVKIFNYEKISYSDSRTTIKSSEANGTFSKFAVTLDFLSINDFLTMFQFSAHIFTKGQESALIPLRPCLASDWSALGSSYQQDFKSYFLQYMFCPNTTQQFFIGDTFRSDKPDYIKILLSACNPTQNSQCNLTETENYILGQSVSYASAEVWIFVLDKAILPESQKPVNYFINIDARAQVTSKFGGAAVIEFSTFKIKTDTTVWPWEEITTESGCFVDSVRNYQIDFINFETSPLSVIKFTMNQKQYVLNRVVGKLDNLLSYAGGLFSIIIGFFVIFLKSYNQYKYQLSVAEGAFALRKDGYQVKQKNLNFWVYVKYTIFDWVHILFCCKINWKDCLELDQTRQEIINSLQADKFYRRISRIQNISKSHISKDENICMHIIAPPHIEDIKHERLLSSYYNEITENRSQLTLSEIKNKDDHFLDHDKEASIEYLDANIFKSSAVMNQAQKSSVSEQISMTSDRIQLVRSAVEHNPELKEFAEKTVLKSEFQQIEKEIVQSFFRLEQKTRQALQQKVPLLILYRLLKSKQSKDKIN